VPIYFRINSCFHFCPNPLLHRIALTFCICNTYDFVYFFAPFRAFFRQCHWRLFLFFSFFQVIRHRRFLLINTPKWLEKLFLFLSFKITIYREVRKTCRYAKNAKRKCDATKKSHLTNIVEI
jgi:hypothetical protein